MPIYQYECDECGLVFEKRQSFSDAPLKRCPECNASVHRVFQPVGIIFKGSGFYVTDNKKASPTATPGESKNGTGGKSEETRSTPEAKETAPAASTTEKSSKD